MIKMQINDLKIFKNIIITGGKGFIGGALIRRLLKQTGSNIYSIDKIGYASNPLDIKEFISNLKDEEFKRYKFVNLDLVDYEKTKQTISQIDPDIIIHLAAESHVDRSIEKPDSFIQSNIIGTYNLLEAVRLKWQIKTKIKKDIFRFYHISTDKVFGSLEDNNKFNENTNYDPRSPYSASKAASDHLVRAWNNTYGIPTLISNCSNNFGPWQFPEKLIPLVIYKAINNEQIPLYGDGGNIRDWIYVEDHIDAIIRIASKGQVGRTYCIGGNSEITNKDLVLKICSIMNDYFPNNSPHQKLIKYVEDRPGHDKRYAINTARIKNELGWEPNHSFDDALLKTVDWYLKNQEWYTSTSKSSGYKGERIGNKKT